MIVVLNDIGCFNSFSNQLQLSSVSSKSREMSSDADHRYYLGNTAESRSRVLPILFHGDAWHTWGDVATEELSRIVSLVLKWLRYAQVQTIVGCSRVRCPQKSPKMKLIQTRAWCYSCRGCFVCWPGSCVWDDAVGTCAGPHLSHSRGCDVATKMATVESLKQVSDTRSLMQEFDVGGTIHVIINNQVRLNDCMTAIWLQPTNGTHFVTVERWASPLILWMTGQQCTLQTWALWHNGGLAWVCYYWYGSFRPPLNLNNLKDLSQPGIVRV